MTMVVRVAEECPHCGGTGKWQVPAAHKGGTVTGREERCRECAGLGVVHARWIPASELR